MLKKLLDSFIHIGQTEGWKRTIVYHLNNLPNFLYPGVYDANQDHNILSPIFWWRQLFHLIGGALICLIGSLVLKGKEAFIISALLVFTMMIIKECLFDAKEQVNGFDFKNFMDSLIWTMGYSLVGYLLIK